MSNICDGAILRKYRSSRRRCFVRKGVLRNFAKFTGKHMCQSLFYNKVADLRPATIKKDTLAQVFFCEFCKISKNTFFTEHLWAAASEDSQQLKPVNYFCKKAPS